jgi:hypothetical protein
MRLSLVLLPALLGCAGPPESSRTSALPVLVERCTIEHDHEYCYTDVDSSGNNRGELPKKKTQE